METMFWSKRIYLDTASTTPLDPRVKRAMGPFWSGTFGNPSSIHQEGQKARRALEDARRQIASRIGALPDEIIFTAGATEANNLALTAVGDDGLVISAIEHPSIINPARALEESGQSVKIISVLEDGFVDLDKARQLISPDTKLVSVIWASNEIGTIQPIKEIVKIARRLRTENGTDFPLVHTDASQVARFLPIDVRKLGVDLLTLGGGKIYGPKGVGILYKRRGVSIRPLVLGGGQEAGSRSGTENIPAIVGLAKALEIADSLRDEESARLTKIRDYFWQELKKNFPTVVLNGSLENRLPNNLNVSFPGLDGEQLVIELDARGVACSTGSACSMKETDQSYVIMALTGDIDRAQGAVRFSLGRETVMSDIDQVVGSLKKIINKLNSF